MKLHLGSGNKYRDGWINVDLYAERVDVRADLRTVEFPASETESTECIHTLEHFTRDDCLKICWNVFSWLKPGGTFAVEMPNRSRCIALCGSKIVKKQINGAKGLMGGRGHDKESWHRWLIENRRVIAERSAAGVPPIDLAPESFRIAGQDHLYVWDANEFAVELERIGFITRIESASHHGFRFGRDFRCVGVKP